MRKKQKFILLFLLLFCFNDNSMCLAKIARFESPQSSNLCTTAKLGYSKINALLALNLKKNYQHFLEFLINASNFKFFKKWLEQKWPVPKVAMQKLNIGQYANLNLITIRDA